MKLYVLFYEDQINGENIFYGIFKNKKSMNKIMREKKKEWQEESWFDDDEIECMMTCFKWYTDSVEL